MPPVLQLPFAITLAVVASGPVSVWALDAPGEAENYAEIEKITVLGQQAALDTEVALTPGAVTVVDATELSLRNMNSLADMLRYVPGVWVAGGATGDSTFFSSRGSNLDATNYDGNGIKLLQDGLPVTAADGNNHNRAVDPLSARYAVVARGANALTYGASTLGGAIDFITPTARDSDDTILSVNGGSHGQLQGRLTVGKVSGQFDGLVTVEAKQSDGFRQHQKQQRQGLYANAGWQFNEQVTTRFYFNYVDNDQELPGALTRAQFEQDPYQAEAAAVTGHYQFNVQSWRLANKTSWDINADSSLSLGVSYEQQALYHPIVFSPFFSLLIDTDQHNSGIALRYNVRMAQHDLLFGVNYGNSTVKGGNYSQANGIKTGLTTTVDNSADSLEVFVMDRWQLATDWTLIYGAQMVSASREVRNTNVASNALYNPKGNYHSINPRLGLIYKVSEQSELFANVSRLYEPPTNYELEDDVSADNKALQAMRGKVIELGSRGHKALNSTDNVYWELALYYGKLDNEILSVDDPNAPGTSLSANIDSTIHAGVEALLGASFALDDAAAHRIEPLLSFTLNEFSFDNDPVYGDNTLPAAPGHVLKGEVLYRHANGFFAGPTFDIVASRYADFSNTYKVDSYNLLGFRLGLATEQWEWYAELRNLTGKKYVSLFSVKDRAAPEAAILQAGEPRSVYVGAKVRF